jgi:hypothetical protein
MTAHLHQQQFPVSSPAALRVAAGFERRDIGTRAHGTQSQRVLRDGVSFDRARGVATPLWRESLSLLEKLWPSQGQNR